MCVGCSLLRNGASIIADLFNFQGNRFLLPCCDGKLSCVRRFEGAKVEALVSCGKMHIVSAHAKGFQPNLWFQCIFMIYENCEGPQARALIWVMEFSLPTRPLSPPCLGPIITNNAANMSCASSTGIYTCPNSHKSHHTSQISILLALI